MLGRERREERRAERHGAERYQMRQKLMSIGEDSWVEDSSGHRAFKVNGKALHLRRTLDLEDASGAECYRIQSRPVHIRDSMKIVSASGDDVATVKKALVSPVHERFNVERATGKDWKAHGNIVDHEYEIECDGDKVAEVSKKWFRVRDTYGIEVAPGQDAALAIAVTVCIDELSHD